MHGVLKKILAGKDREVAALKEQEPLAQLRERALNGPVVRDFLAALKKPGRVPVIAEIKRRSPSAGDLAQGASADIQAKAYEAGGAAAISILTDGPHFGGSLADLESARLASGLPVLRKDFIIDQAQIYQARAAGADAVLLIAAALEPEELKRLYQLTRELGMSALIEVHQPGELEPVLALDPPLIGINNRNLDTLEVSLQTCLDLRPMIPPGTLVVAESGVKSPQDVARLRAAGLDAFLVGSSLMSAGDPQQALSALVEVAL